MCINCTQIISQKEILHSFFSQNNFILNLDAEDTTMVESPVKSPPDDSDVVSSSNTQTGLDKLRSIFKSNSGSGDSVQTPKKTVHFQIPPDIKELYSGDPKLENYVLEQMQEEEKKREEQLAKVAQQKEKEEAERHAQEEAKQAEILKNKQLEDEIR